ncbi:MAG: chromate efflux transporter [Snowella sp.]|nr:chromate efflux transporter [Snowella sp.]
MVTDFQRFKELVAVFLKLGIIGFGGPAAHLALMEEEIINRRQWLTRSQFLDLLGATNLIPGPNSTEMAIHIGYRYGGWLGLVVAGSCFILPAVVITSIFAWLYVTWGSLPELTPVLAGIKAGILAVIASAVWRLGKKVFKSRQLLGIALLVILLVLLGTSETVALFVGGIIGMILLMSPFPRNPSSGTLPLLMLGVVTAEKAIAMPPTLVKLGLFFLKVGSILFGSGYVLFAFLEGDLVNRYGWLTQQQLLDAIAVGQLTPGPILSTATFIGYLILGTPGAIVATVGIFFPSFVFVALSHPLIAKLRQSKWASAFLDAVNASSVALIVVVTGKLAQSVLWKDETIFSLNWAVWLISAIAGIAVFRYRVNSVWIVLGSAVLGYGLKGVIALQ